MNTFGEYVMRLPTASSRRMRARAINSSSPSVSRLTTARTLGLELGCQRRQQLLVGVGESLHALAFEYVGHVVHVDPNVTGGVQDSLGGLRVVIDRPLHRAVIGKRLDRRLGQRVDGVGP